MSWHRKLCVYDISVPRRYFVENKIFYVYRRFGRTWRLLFLLILSRIECFCTPQPSDLKDECLRFLLNADQHEVSSPVSLPIRREFSIVSVVWSAYPGSLAIVGPDSSVGMSTGYDVGGPRIESRWQWNFFQTRPDVLCPPPAVKCIQGSSRW